MTPDEKYEEYEEYDIILISFFSLRSVCIQLAFSPQAWVDSGIRYAYIDHHNTRYGCKVRTEPAVGSRVGSAQTR